MRLLSIYFLSTWLLLSYRDIAITIITDSSPSFTQDISKPLLIDMLPVT